MKTVIGAAMLVCAFALPATAAEKCRLEQVAAFTLKPVANGDYTIPLTIAGADRDFVAGLHNPFSAISGTFADAQGYKSTNLPYGISTILRGEEIKQRVAVPEFSLGGSHARNFEMLRTEKFSPDPKVVGLAALDLFENFDVEVDFANKRMKLFSQDHCEGQVIYWTGSYAQIPFKTDVSGQVSIPMRLDGKKLNVALEIGDSAAYMGMLAAKRIFGLSADSPGMSAVRHGDGVTYQYAFKALSVEGVEVDNPRIDILPETGPECLPQAHLVGEREQRCFGGNDLMLGGSVLSALHLYFAFKERQLYVTPAGAHL